MTIAVVTRRPWYRLRVGGEQVELAAAFVQNEALEGVVTTVLDAEIESVISLATNVAADLYAVEQDAETITAQFAGVVNRISGQSYPNRIVLTCTGPLARLRHVPAADVDLSGMTDGAAVEAILTACGVTFDAADIQDAGYVLGAQTPVYWSQDQPGREIVAELDRVFGMATIEVGAGRVARFAYDRAPSAGDISATYTRGVDAEFWVNQRDRGDLDAIVNAWQVRGASWQDSDDCTLTPWSRGDADNDALEPGERNRAGSFQSGIIQDEALAAAVATRMLRWYNRQPDELQLIALNDQNINVGDVIGVKDEAYGVDLTASATATPYLVLTVDRRGDEMTVAGIGGDAGSTGTITTGVDKACNADIGSFDLPGSFTVPLIGFPPLVPIDPYAAVGDGAPDGSVEDVGWDGGPPHTCVYGCFTPGVEHWVIPPGVSVTPSAGQVIFVDMNEDAEIELEATCAPVASNVRMAWSGHIEFSVPGDPDLDEPVVTLLLRDFTAANFYAGFEVTWTPGSSGFIHLYGFDGDFHEATVTSATITDGFDVEVVWDPNTGIGGTLSYTFTTGFIMPITHAITLGAFTDATPVFGVASATEITMTMSDLSICFGPEV